MSQPSRHQSIQDFFDYTARLEAAYQEPSFSYLAFKSGKDFVLVQAALFLNVLRSKAPFTHFKSENVRAGHYLLSELGLDAKALVEQLLTGVLHTPDGDLQFPKPTQGEYTSIYV